MWTYMPWVFRMIGKMSHCGLKLKIYPQFGIYILSDGKFYRLQAMICKPS